MVLRSLYTYYLKGVIVSTNPHIHSHIHLPLPTHTKPKVRKILVYRKRYLSALPLFINRKLALKKEHLIR